MKLKAGDRLLCKKTDAFNLKYKFIKDKYYIVNNSYINNALHEHAAHLIYGENNKLYLFTNHYLWNYFYTPQEVRKMKLKQLKKIK